MSGEAFHTDGEPFGVYLHWPFCAAKCPYCDFNSHVRHRPVDQEVFAGAYEREIAHMASLAPDRRVTSIFFGGGTPSLMEPATVGRLLDAVARHWPVAADAEITLEANPSSVDAENFKGYRKAGVNRLSLGVQSLDDAQLRFLGRLHDAAEAVRAIALARETFPRLSFDMIYARPGQTPQMWEAELSHALELAADHLSLYQLTIERGTPFFELHKRGKLGVPDAEHAALLLETTQALTSARQLPAYEISNHAAKGAESRHNLTYWRYQDYAGIGPGAHGRLTVDGEKQAVATERNPEKWWQQTMVEGNGITVCETLSRREAADEFLLMGMRLAEGIDPARYTAISGEKLHQGKIAELHGHGFVELSRTGRLRATPAGAMVLDAVVADLAA